MHVKVSTSARELVSDTEISCFSGWYAYKQRAFFMVLSALAAASIALYIRFYAKSSSLIVWVATTTAAITPKHDLQ